MSEVTGSKNRNSLLNAALEKGDDFYKRVEIDGRVYCVFKSQGNDILRLGSTDTQKAAAVGKICIDAIKAKTEQDHIDSGVRELNATGLDFEDGHHQGAEGATLSSDQADVLLEELTSSQSKLDGLYNQIESSSDTEFPKENINKALRSFLVQPPKAKYTKDEVLDAIKGCAKHQVRLARDTVFGDKSKEKETQFNAIFNQDKSINGLINDSKALLKDSMTAETAWKVMEAIFSSTQYHVVLDPTVTIISSSNSTATDTINTDTLPSPVRTGMDLLDQVVDGATKSSETTDRDSSIVLPYVSRQELQNMIEDPRVEQPKKRTWGDTARDAWSWVPTPKFWNWKSQGLWGSSATTTQKQFEHPKERG